MVGKLGILTDKKKKATTTHTHKTDLQETLLS